MIGFTPLLPSLPRLLAETQRQAALATRRLSTGLRIERASDGAAELALAEQARARLRSTLAARRNALTGIDVLRTADGGLDQIGGLLLRMRELAVQAAQGVLGDTERGFLDQELQQAVREMERIALTTRFDELPLLVREKVDVGFLVDVSASMSASIATLKTQVGAFEDQLTRQGLDVAFGLARVGADNVDRVDRSADIGVGFDGALAALGIAGFFPMDPYSAITEVLGETSVSGAIEPDAFTWRPGAARVLVYLTDTGRETAAQSLTEEEVGDAAADRTVTVHIVGTPGSGDDDDGVPGSDLDGIAARSGGTYFSRGTSSGSGIEAALAAIARTVEGSAGPTQIAFHIDVGSAEGEDRLVLDALPFDARPSALDVADVSIATEEGARDALAKIDGAIEGVSSLRADAGALMNRLASAARTLEAREVADRASRSRLVDADVAVEAAALARQQLLARAMVGLLPKVQAIQRDAVLRLLSG